MREGEGGGAEDEMVEWYHWLSMDMSLSKLRETVKEASVHGVAESDVTEQQQGSDCALDLLLIMIQLVWESHLQKYYKKHWQFNYFHDKMIKWYENFEAKLSRHCFFPHCFLYLYSHKMHNQQKSKSVNCSDLDYHNDPLQWVGNLKLWSFFHATSLSS